MYATSRGSAIAVPIAACALAGSAARARRSLRSVVPLPNLHDSGLLSVSRMQVRFEVWAYPLDSCGAERARRRCRMTNQTGQVLTPSAPDGNQIAYLSDSGGHANIWVMSAKGPPHGL